MELQDLRLMRNEIFARYGYIFKSADLKAHFGSKPWYQPLYAEVTAKLTEMEKKNAELLSRQEERVRTTGEFNEFYELFMQAFAKDQLDKVVGLAHTDLMGGEEHVRDSFRLLWDKVKKAAINTADPEPVGNRQRA